MHKKKLFAFSALAAFVLLGVAATNLPLQKDRNLKILPKDISDAKLDSIMHTYNVALGVNCNFCHVKQRLRPDSLDYASDAEPIKEEARKMMRMTIDINKNNFYFDEKERPEYLRTITCKTCHRGNVFPPED
ncbi:MAG: c-type cytochrome [Chitinophagaceae bacterium]